MAIQGGIVLPGGLLMEVMREQQWQQKKKRGRCRSAFKRANRLTVRQVERDEYRGVAEGERGQAAESRYRLAICLAWDGPLEPLWLEAMPAL
jgi:hypothetical protein